MNEPIWGWPWHGRVDKDGLLHLPNGETMAYYSPLSMSSTTYRVKVPGIAPVERTPAELAEDEARGIEWRNEQILNGYTLCRRELRGWIYCAPDGTRWIIRLNLTVAGTSNNPEAVRFGVLGGAPEPQPLTVSWPTDDLEVNDTLIFGDGGTYGVQRWFDPVDISPDGSRAIYMLYVNDPAFELQMRPLPVGFQLVTVSGERGAISVSITTLRTMEQTLGTTEFEDLRDREERTNRQTIPQQAGTIRTLAPDRLKSDDPPGTVYATGSLQTGGDYIKSVGTMESNVRGRILAMWFDPQGEIIECTIDRIHRLEVSFPQNERTSTDDPNRDRWARITERISRNERVLRVGGVEVHTFWVEERQLRDRFYSAGSSTRHEYEITFDDGRHRFEETISDAAVIEDPLEEQSQLVQLYAGDEWRILSNNVVALVRRYRNENDTNIIQYRGCATPYGPYLLGGEVEGVFDRYQPSGPLTSACFNPFTGEVSDPAGDTMTFV